MVMGRTRAKRPAEPLWIVDQLVYWFFMILILILSFSYIFVPTMIKENIAFSDPNVIAYDETAGILWTFPGFFIFFLTTFIPWVYGYQGRKPIFGAYRNSSYINQYSHYYEKQKKRQKKEAKKQRKLALMTAILLLPLILLSFLFPAMAIYGRECLYEDGSIRRFNLFNSISREYAPEERTSLTIGCGLYGGGRYSRGHWEADVKITCADGKSYSFSSRDFRGETKAEIQLWLREMTELKAQFDPAVINYMDLDDLPKVIDEQKLSPEEQALLYELFSVEESP